MHKQLGSTIKKRNMREQEKGYVAKDGGTKQKHKRLTRRTRS